MAAAAKPLEIEAGLIGVSGFAQYSPIDSDEGVGGDNRCAWNPGRHGCCFVMGKTLDGLGKRNARGEDLIDFGRDRVKRNSERRYQLTPPRRCGGEHDVRHQTAARLGFLIVGGLLVTGGGGVLQISLEQITATDELLTGKRQAIDSRLDLFGSAVFHCSRQVSQRPRTPPALLTDRRR